MVRIIEIPQTTAMFGGSKPAFGQPATTSGFGSFNAPNASPFGQSTFGKPTTTFPATPAFGGQNTSLFGTSTQPAGGLFGGSTGTPAFGAPATTQSFGFGQTSANNTLFGNNAAPAASTSLFGASTTTSAFGQPTKASTFGFGSAQPTGGLFGQSTAPQQATSSGMFGQNTAGTTTGLFGSTGFGATAGNTTGTVIKFNPVTGTDTMVKNGQSNSINTQHHCITCMKEYENKSLEELRLEDYMANRKGPQSGGVQPGGMFGASQPAQGGLFGAQQTNVTSAGMFGQQENKSMFGATPAMGGFGSTAPAFGTSAQAGTSGLFGKPMTGFGGQPATTTSAFTFNTNTAANPFGQSAAKPFGATAPQPGGLFGQPATSSFGATNTGFGGFGAQTAQTTGLFGATKPATPFNMPTATGSNFGAFGQTNTTTTATSGLFGAKPATTGFGAPTTGFGAPAQNTGFGGFGQPNTSSLFNSSFNKPATTSTFGGFGGTTTLGTGLNMGGTSSIFGNNAAKPGGLFGGTTSGTGGLFGNTGTSFNQASGLGTNSFGGSMLGAQLAQQANVPIHQQIMLLSQPFGESPLFKNLAPASGKVEELLNPTNPAAQKALLESSKYKMSPAYKSVSVKVKPIVGLSSNPKKSLFDGLEEEDSSVEKAFTLKPNAKHLSLKPKKNSQESPDGANLSRNHPTNNEVQFGNGVIENEPNATDEVPTRRVSWLNTSTLNRVKDRDNANRNSSGSDQSVFDNTVVELRTKSLNTQAVTSTPFPEKRAASYVLDNMKERNTERSGLSSNVKESLQTGSLNADKTVTGGEEDKENISNSSSGSNRSSDEVPAAENISHPTGIVLTRAGYYTIPSLDELPSFISNDGTCVVPNFTVGREGYGNVYFPDSFDVSDLNLDEIVHFRHKEVVIYTDDLNKPPVGQGLNRRAQVTLDRVWPHDKTLHEPITDPQRLAQMDYEGKLRRVCAKHDTRFLEYRPQTGSWVFKVDHFSKYGLSDSDDDEEVIVDPKKKIAIQRATDVSGVPKQGSLLKKTDVPETEQDLQGTKPDLTGTKPQHAPTGLGGYVNGQANGHYNGFNSESDCPGFLDGEDDEMGTTWIDLVPSAQVDDGPTSPSGDLARQAGTNSHKVQLMKASFFIEDDDDMKSNSDLMEVCGRETPDQTVPRGLVLRAQLHSNREAAQSPKPAHVNEHVESTPVQPLASNLKHNTPQGPQATAPIVKPVTVILKHPGQVLPYTESLAARLHYRCLADSAISNGRRFKVGWGPRNTMANLTTQDNATSVPTVCGFDDLHCYLQERNKEDRSANVVQILKLADPNTEEFRESVEGHLDIQLSHSKFSRDSGASSCPLVVPQMDSLEHHCEMAKLLCFKKSAGRGAQYNNQVWQLLAALWGEMPATEGNDPSDHLTVMSRRKELTEWLSVWTEPADKLGPNTCLEEHLPVILSLLAQHDIALACDLAQKHGDHYLALLISQLSGEPILRQFVQQQITSWIEVDADKFVPKERLRLLMLVAGVALIDSSHGTINVCEGLHWKRALAIHLWYICPPTASITDALLMYEKAFTEFEYANPPDPPYSDSYRLENGSDRPMRDLCFHLLKLYSSRSYPLEGLLNPATHTPDVTDYRLSWFLQEMLQSLGYSHSSELSTANVHTSFASQLEAHGMWHWAVFVLMHIEHMSRRESAILKVLERHVILSDSLEYYEQEKFVIDRLGVPATWVHRAKAVHAGTLHKHHEQAKLFTAAEMWNEAHSIIMEHLSSDALIDGNHEYLRILLEPLARPECSAVISGWLYQGQLLWDYLEVDAEVQKLISNPTDNIGYHLESLQPQISSLCSRVKQFPCPTSKHTLCQSELAKRTACIVRGILMQTGRHEARALGRLIADLPLPEDYAQQEMRTLVDGCLGEFCIENVE